MKKNLVSLLFLITAINIFAQDTIVKISGEEIQSKVVEITSTIVKYKKFSNLDGPIYSIEKVEIEEIAFENGDIEIFTKQENDESNKQNAVSDSSIIQEGNGKVYFIRSTGFAGSMSAFTAFIDETLVCKLNNKKYSIHEVTPGEHTFTVQFAGKNPKDKAEPILINVEAGKTYYIQMVFQTGAFKNNLYSQEVTENSAKTILVDCEEDTKCL
jgi:hypothetical protein